MKIFKLTFAILLAGTFLFSCNDAEVLPTVDVMNEDNIVETSTEEAMLRKAENNTLEVKQVTLDELNRAFADAGLETISDEELFAIQTRTNGQAPNANQCLLALHYGPRLANDTDVLTLLDVVKARQVVLFCGANDTETTRTEMLTDQACVAQYTSLVAAYNACLISWPDENNTLTETDIDIMICAILGYC